MSPEAQRVVIAEACGWMYEPYFVGGPAIWLRPDGFPETHRTACLPDYVNDLNAAIQLVDHLAKQGWRCECNSGLDGTWECLFYRKATNETKLENRAVRGQFDPPDSEEHYATSERLSAAISEAFLRTLNKWYDSK